MSKKKINDIKNIQEGMHAREKEWQPTYLCLDNVDMNAHMTYLGTPGSGMSFSTIRNKIIELTR